MTATSFGLLGGEVMKGLDDLHKTDAALSPSEVLGGHFRAALTSQCDALR